MKAVLTHAPCQHLLARQSNILRSAQIHGCDAIIGKVESRLGHFDAELSKVNREIQSLEEDSGKLTAMLRNRLAAADVLGRWLQSATVPPDLITAVRDGDVAEAEGYTATLHELRTKMANMHSFSDFGRLQSFPMLQVRSAHRHRNAA
jgi:septal ring factor EnvC (AmiA/AmiB activator)